MDKVVKEKLFSVMLDELNYNNTKAAEILNYTERQIRNYKNGYTEVPEEVFLKLKSIHKNANVERSWTPLWLRIKNYKIDKCDNNFVYALNDDSELELYNPEIEKNKFKDKRIYLEFINSLVNGNYGVALFMEKYGFIGATSLTIESGENEKLFNYLSPFLLRQKYFNSDCNKRCKCIKESLLKDHYDFKQFSKELAKDLIGYEPTGYFEIASDIKNYWIRDMATVITTAYLLDGNDEYFSSLLDHGYTWMNVHFEDLTPIVVNNNFNIDMEFGFKTLLAYMYHELFLDLKQNVVPVLCTECRLYHLPEDIIDVEHKIVCNKCGAEL